MRKTQKSSDSGFRYGEAFGFAKIKKDIIRLISLSRKEKYYWAYCDLESFKKAVPGLKIIYLKENIDSTEIDFWENELMLVNLKLKELKYPVLTELKFQINLNHILKLKELNDVKYSERSKQVYVSDQIDILKGTKNPYPMVFSLPQDYLFFMYLLEKLGSGNDDLSFIYRKLTSWDYISKSIVCTEGDFMKFCREELKKPISRLKSMNYFDERPERRDKFKNLKAEFYRVT